MIRQDLVTSDQPETDKRCCSRKAAYLFHLAKIKNQTKITIRCLLSRMIIVKGLCASAAVVVA